MASSKHWSLYASNRRVGKDDEHRLSGARIGRVGVYLSWNVMHGWEATVHVLRFTAKVAWAPRKDDPRVQSWLAALMGRMGTNLGLADLNDGRLYEGMDNENGPARPASSWKPDDPQPPIGWHHDGTQWVQNDDGGWWRDRRGYWRYNRPGDVGWQEQPDGSWKYSEKPA